MGAGSRHGRCSVATSRLGAITSWVWRRAIKRPRPLVVICDISGSMERHPACSCGSCRPCRRPRPSRRSRSCSGRGSRASRVSCGTAIATVRSRRWRILVTDWAGGTRIGRILSRVQRNGPGGRPTSGVVIVVSDGWDRGDPALVAVESARLRRNCHRLTWLNPLAGTAGYQPLAAGMRAAFPYIDDFLAAGTVASLERLGEVLAVRGPPTSGAVARPRPMSRRPRPRSSPRASPPRPPSTCPQIRRPRRRSPSLMP